MLFSNQLKTPIGNQILKKWAYKKQKKKKKPSKHEWTS